MNVTTLRDYAKQNNISYEAVRKQVVRYAAELDGHLIKDGRQQFLDEEAVAFLDAKRQKNPLAIIQQSKDEAIETLRQEKENLLTRIANIQDELLKEKDKVQDLLEEKKEEIARLEAQNGDLSRDINKEREQRLEAQKTLETLVNGSWSERRKLRRELKKKNRE